MLFGKIRGRFHISKPTHMSINSDQLQKSVRTKMKQQMQKPVRIRSEPKREQNQSATTKQTICSDLCLYMCLRRQGLLRRTQSAHLTPFPRLRVYASRVQALISIDREVLHSPNWCVNLRIMYIQEAYIIKLYVAIAMHYLNVMLLGMFSLRGIIFLKMSLRGIMNLLVFVLSAKDNNKLIN